MKQYSPILVTLFGAIFLAFLFITPPGSVGVDHDGKEFSSGRAMQDVRVIAAEPHPTGTPENAKVRKYIIERLLGLGLDVDENAVEITGSPVERLNRWSGRNDTAQTIYNIVGTLPGRDRSKSALLLMAHHDTVWDSPGASDDTIGIAVILEVLRAIADDANRERDVIVLVTDAEELGLAGASHFFENNPLRDRVGVVVNLEARGAGGTANLFQLNKGNSEAARFFAKHVREPSISSLSALIYETLPNDTDLTPALGKDYVAYNMAIIGKAGMYHSPKITADELSQGSVQHMGVQTLDLTRALLSADALPGKSNNAAFFDVFGLAVIVYAPVWGWVFLGVGGICFWLSIRGRFSRAEVQSGFIQMTIFILLGFFLLYVLNWLSGHGKTYEGVLKGAGYYDRLAAIPRLEVIALLGCLAVFFASFLKHEYNGSRYLGLAIPLIAIGALVQIWAAPANYIISIPVALAGMTALVNAQFVRSRAVILSIPFALPVLGYMIGLTHMLLLGVGPDLLSIAVLPCAISFLAVWPILPQFSKGRRRGLFVFCLTLAIIIALWVRWDAVADTVPVYRVW